MAQIKNTTLAIESASAADKRKVTVGFKLTFTAADAGKTFRYRIGLRGDDAGEEITAPLGFYYFRFNGNNTSSSVLTAEQGEKSFSQTRDISVQILNEDPGFKFVHIANTTIKIPKLDELIAEVSLYRTTPNSDLSALVDKKLSPIKIVAL